jgi:hypothetical protein
VATVRYDRANIFRLLHSPAEGPHREVASVTRKTSAIAKATVPVDTGRLKNTHTESVTDEGARLVGRVAATAEYAIYVHEGHGVIRPKNAKVLAFRVGGQLVFARQVRPVDGRPWLVNALKAASPWPVVENPT